MKISTKTLNILKNAASINPNILIKRGNKVNTVSQGTDILLRATVEEEFPVPVSIYDLNNFLGTLTLIGDQDITFNDDSLNITTDGGHSIEYFYAGDGLVKWDDKWEKPVKKLGADDLNFQFTMTDKELSLIQKAATVLSAPFMSVIGNGKEVLLVVGSPSVKSSNNYKKVLGKSKEKFDYRISMDTLKVVSDTYTVMLPKGKKRLYLQGTNYTTEYWLATVAESTV